MKGTIEKASIQDKKLTTTPTCGQFFIGVKAIIEKDGKILLIKRSGQYKDLSYTWDIPGGRINFGEEPIDGLRREIVEETGLELDTVKEILDASTVLKNEEKQIVRITYRCTVKDGTTTLSHEHTEMEWVLIEKLNKIELKDKLLKRTLEKFILLF